MSLLPVPKPEQIIYEDKKLYACLANYPITKGHVVLVWKKNVPDLHLLPKKDYAYLMEKVGEVRNAMLKALHIKKIYLIYMDETNHVHWHLVPRYTVKGVNVLEETPKKLKDFGLAEKIRYCLV